MTMQVGMVGSDGVLIASDTKSSDSPETQPSFGESLAVLRQTTEGSKIIVDHKRGIAISCARTRRTAQRVAYSILEKLRDDEVATPCRAIEKIGKEVLDAISQNQDTTGLLRDAQCLIAMRFPSPSLYMFRLGLTGQTEWGTECEKMEGTVAAGDRVNAALFWKERYYQRHRPIKSLVPLAAHLIVSASKLPGSIVSGLDIILCGRTAIRRLRKDSIRKLEKQADKWDKRIGAMIESYTQDYEFED